MIIYIILYNLEYTPLYKVIEYMLGNRIKLAGANLQFNHNCSLAKMIGVEHISKSLIRWIVQNKRLSTYNF